MQGDLDVSVLVNELDAAIKALSDASDTTLGGFPDTIFALAGVCLLILIDQVLADHSDHGDNSEQE